jgi:hypothetical protein
MSSKAEARAAKDKVCNALVNVSRYFLNFNVAGQCFVCSWEISRGDRLVHESDPTRSD